MDEMEERLLDTPQVQRLRGIRQLAMAYLVYPGANHTRFEHSIGTLFLADSICGEIGLDEEKRRMVRAAALLHDVGHVAFSHESESVLKARLGNHEEIGERMVAKGEIADILSENFNPKKIAALHKTSLGQIISSDIGADRMDYLLRDSHYTGVAYGVIDSQRICSSLRLEESGLVLDGRGLSAAENLLVARFEMFSTVYLHKTVRIASRMLQKSLALALEEGTLAASDALSQNDAQLLSALSSSGEGKDYAVRLMERRLFKKAYALPAQEFSAIGPGQEKFEAALSASCGCPVLLDVPHLALGTNMEMDIDGRRTRLSDESELVASLAGVQEKRLDVLVMCPEEKIAKVASAAASYFKAKGRR